jgi:predicted nicotinamide N-methyase
MHDWVDESISFEGASDAVVQLCYQHAGGLDVMSAAHMGLHCWDGAFLLSQYMVDHADLFRRHSSLIELGAGPGLCGLLNGALFGGAPAGRSIVLTDGHMAACSLLAKNVGANVADEEVHVRRLRWGHDADVAALPLSQFDVVIAADCTFSEPLNAPLIETAGRLLRRSGGTLVLSVSTRTKLLIPQIVALCAQQGLALREPTLDEHGCPVAGSHARTPTMCGESNTDDARTSTGAGWIFRFER